jgi:hypothetical protein
MGIGARIGKALSELKIKARSVSAIKGTADFISGLGDSAINRLKSLTKRTAQETAVDAKTVSKLIEDAVPENAANAGKVGEAGQDLGKKASKLVGDAGDDPKKLVKPIEDCAANAEKNMDGSFGSICGFAVKALVALMIVTCAAVIIKSYGDKAEEERRVCLADWTAKYVDVLTRPDGTLHQIDTPEEWTQSIKEIQAHILALKDVNNDEEKAKDFLLTMNEGLIACLTIDTSPLGATLKGLARDTGSAVEGVIKGFTKPLAAALDSVSNNVTTILIAVGSVIGAIILLLIVYYFTSKNESVVNMRNRHKELMRSKYHSAIELQRRLRDKVAPRLRRRPGRRFSEPETARLMMNRV